MRGAFLVGMRFSLDRFRRSLQILDNNIVRERRAIFPFPKRLIGFEERYIASQSLDTLRSTWHCAGNFDTYQYVLLCQTRSVDAYL